MITKCIASRLATAIGSLGLWLCAGTAPVAAQTVELKVADTLPGGHSIHRFLLHPYMEAVEKATGGKIKLKHFPGGQLGKTQDMLMLTQTGVIDIGYVGPSYISDKLPHTAAVELPGVLKDYCRGFDAYWKLTHGGILDQKDFAPNGIVPLLILMLPAYQVQLGTDRQINSVKDLSGLKLRTTGGALEFVAKSLGIVPVRMSPPEIYEALSRGTIDGYLMAYQSTAAYSLERLLKSATSNSNFGTIVVTFSMSKAKLDSLGAETAKMLVTLGEKHVKEACPKFAAEEREAFEKSKAGGMKVFEFSEADNKVLEDAFAKARADWVETMEKRGKAGKAVMEAVLAAVKD